MLLNKIIRDTRKLSREELQKLQAHLQSELARQEQDPDVNREVIEKKTVGSTHYYLMKIRCGKKNCKCSRGELHGPYWYAFRQENGHAKRKYIGKALPDGAELLKFSEALRKRAERGRVKSGEIRDMAERARLASKKTLSVSRIRYPI